MTEGLRLQIDRIGKMMPGATEDAKRRAEISYWAAMIGSVILTRAIEEPALSSDVLAETRTWINAGIKNDL